ncbi:hypothetical protein AC579_7552 [Pseudocercospora musae]|uniref:Rab-GAP TBC domain-containing protein n=1 Tax=Pseudocercospora musae TaxID=113226 RepID=A0A139IHL9_9PEZI|nr:hypothetical protein AC579_7552 [Pseudocercospora musae]
MSDGANVMYQMCNIDTNIDPGRSSSSSLDRAHMASLHSINAVESDKAKVGRILAACRHRHLGALRELAASEHGLIDDELRRTAWPLLLGCNDQAASEHDDWTCLARHRDEEQVQLDVNRSFVYYPQSSSHRHRQHIPVITLTPRAPDECEQRVRERKRELSHVITATLRRHPVLCYFQGYHDIIQLLLLVLGAEAATAAAARLSLLRIRDFMLPTLTAAEAHLHLLPSILCAADPHLYNHLSRATQPTPFFALAATLTLYAHDVEEYRDIARLFDYLLASEPVVPLYLFATIVLSRKRELLEIDHDEPDMLHSILSKLPKPLHLERLIHRTQTLFTTYPPEQLPNRAWRRVSSYSVLKTTRDPHALSTQTLQEGERLFAKQAAEIQRQHAVKQVRQRMQALAYQYRRPAKWTGTAILVAALALYLGRTTNASVALGYLTSVARRLSHVAWDVARTFAP